MSASLTSKKEIAALLRAAAAVLDASEDLDSVELVSLLDRTADALDVERGIEVVGAIADAWRKS